MNFGAIPGPPLALAWRGCCCVWPTQGVLKPHRGTVGLGATASERRDCRHENPPPSPQASPSICLLWLPFPLDVIVLAVRWYLRSACPTVTLKSCSPNAGSMSDWAPTVAERCAPSWPSSGTGWWWSGCRPMRPTSTRLRRCGPTSGQELANLACDTLGEVVQATGKGSSASVERGGCRICSCDASSSRCHDPAAPRPEPLQVVSKAEQAGEVVTHLHSACCVGALTEVNRVSGGPRSARSRCP